MKIFLSASVPNPERHAEYTGDIKVSAVRDAIVAFTTVCAEWNIPFYFGGHPAISPLVYGIASKYVDSTKLIKIYQSEFFKGKTPKEVEYYQNIEWTPKDSSGLNSSIQKMRYQMFTENNDTQLVVFIGGMQGIKDEYEMVKEMLPYAEIIPLASTGGASVDVYKDLCCQNKDYSESHAYLWLFQKLLAPFK